MVSELTKEFVLRVSMITFDHIQQELSLLNSLIDRMKVLEVQKDVK